MTVDNLEKFHQKYLAGQQALEKGQYRLSIEYLEAAQELVASNSRQGGEAQIWLVTAYQAANRIDDAIALCEKLIAHPHLQIREQAQRILYIMKAPKLERPKEWMSEIPDLADTETGESRYVAAKKQTSKKSSELELEELEKPQSDHQGDRFILFAFIAIALILSGVALFAQT